MKTVKFPIVVGATFLWIGFICAISFMEAWLKFQAPGITVPLGLGIGRLVFDALNHIEWFFAIVIVVTNLYHKATLISRTNAFYGIVAVLLIAQTFWLLPALDKRAEDVILAKEIAPSNLHIYYVALELVKVACLATFGIKQFKST